MTFAERYRDAIETGIRVYRDTHTSTAIRRVEAVLMAATVEEQCPECDGKGEATYGHQSRHVPVAAMYDYDHMMTCRICGGSGVLRVLPTNGDET